jgi:hypothetical protein
LLQGHGSAYYLKTDTANSYNNAIPIRPRFTIKQIGDKICKEGTSNDKAPSKRNEKQK